MKIEIIKCDLCKQKYQMGINRNYQEVGHIKLDMKGCYYIQTIWEKEICSTCASKIKDAINTILTSLEIKDK